MKLFLLVFAALSGCALCIPAPECRRTRKSAVRFCEDACNPSQGCQGNKKCLCDGNCGYSCIPNGLTCSRPPRIKNGRKSVTGGRSFNATIRYRCRKPYKLLGSAVRKCRGIGKWDGRRARCRIICDEPEDITFGNKRVLGLREGGTVKYWCYPGYNMEGKDTITCGSNAKWDRDPPRCTVPSCNAPPTPRNSFVIYPKKMKKTFVYGQQINYRCVSGTSMSGLGYRRCGSKGVWSQLSFRCIAKSCGNPGIPRNGRKQGYRYTFREKVFYSCDRGHQLNGPRYRQCNANQKWSGRLPSCDPVDCGHLPDPRNGEKAVEGKTTFGGRVIFNCHESLGYELKGFKLRICGADGKWNGTQPTCQLISCGDPGTPTNGGQNAPRGYVYKSYVQFSCDPLYELRGSSRIYCKRDKTWDGAVPECLAPCPRPRNEKGRNVFGNDFRHGKSISFFCDRDYTMVGRRQVSCNDGRWSHNFPSCKAPCRDPGTPGNGRKSWSSSPPFKHGHKAVFYCYRKHRLVGNREISCNDGNWSGGLPRCIPECDKPGYINNGRRTGSDFLDGKVVSFQCNPGYDLFGSSSMRCNKGTWSAAKPSCIRRCRNPGEIHNGRKEGNDYRHNSKVTYRCTGLNYVIDGADTLTCVNGRWDKPIPRCQAPCNQALQLEHGWVSGNNRRHGSTVLYNCNNGYSLVGPNSRTCDNGHWSGNIPECKASCTRPRSITNGAIIGNDFRHNERVTYRCTGNYVLSGDSERTCIDGFWSGREPLCKAPCSDPGSPKNGGKRPSNRRQYKHDTTLHFFCNDHNQLIGASSITCVNGAWDRGIPQCTPVCMDPGQIEHGTRSGTSFLDGKRITYTCNKDYVMEGNSVLQCNKGQWSIKKPSCKAPCQKLGAIHHGTMSSNEFEHKNTVKYRCDRNYTLDGAQILTCMDGSWDNHPPTCKAPCEKPAQIANGNIVGKDFRHNKQVRYACNSQYVLNGNSLVACVDGKWNSTAPNCKAAPCTKIGGILHGRMNRTVNVNGSQLTFACSDGHKLQGPRTLVCINGTWNPAEPPVCKEIYHHIGCYTDSNIRALPEQLDYVTSVHQCFELADAKGYTVFGVHYGQECWSGKNAVATYKKYGKTNKCTKGMGALWANDVYVIAGRVNCSEPPAPKNGKWIGSSFGFQQQLHVQCNQGYDILGTSSITCLLDGGWSALRSNCEARCSPLSNPQNGLVNGNNTRSRQNVTFQCNKGYRLEGESLLTCKDGNWSHDVPKCSAVNCTEPQTPRNGVLVGSHFSFQQQVNFQCNQGYDLFGVSSVTCLSSGMWSASPPTCEAPCSKFVNPPNGLVIGNNFQSRQNVTFQCNKGFKLEGETLLTCKDGDWNHKTPKCSADNCIKIGSKVLGRWHNTRKIDIYHKAEITRLDTLTVTMILDKTINRRPRSKTPHKADSLAFIVDQVPEANELQINTKVVALFDDNIRYFSGKIWYFSSSHNKYRISFDDGDNVFATPSSIRLLKPPPPYCK